MNPSLWRTIIMRAGIVLLACFTFVPFYIEASPVETVEVAVSSTTGDMPGSMEERVKASISSIGNNVFVGKEENIFRLNSEQYNKVLGDIINRVVIGYMVNNLQVDYGTHTIISVQLQPVGKIIRTVETRIDYGNLTTEAANYVKKDAAAIPELMSELLTGLPVDSVGWAESVSQSAGRDLVARVLPEFDAKFEVESGENTKVHIFLIPKGEIVRTGQLSFHKTTVPQILLLRAATKTESAMKSLEGLPINFVSRHREDISSQMREMLLKDSFIKKYEIEVTADLIPGKTSILKVDALTDHWIIKTEAWLDAGREGNKNYAFHGMLGHYIGTNDIVFGEVRLYPGPMDWNVYGGFSHRFGNTLETGYKYDFVESSNHIFSTVFINERMALRYDRDFAKRENEYGLSYKVHNYMTVEYVYNNEEGGWLRLIANL